MDLLARGEGAADAGEVHAGLQIVGPLLLVGGPGAARSALAKAQFGRVDALINNAGYFHSGPLGAATMDQSTASSGPSDMRHGPGGAGLSGGSASQGARGGPGDRSRP